MNGYSYVITRAEIASHVRPLEVTWWATFTINGVEHHQGPMIFSEDPGRDGSPDTPHHSPEAASALAACDPTDRAAIRRAMILDVERAGRELVVALDVPPVDLLAE